MRDRRRLLQGKEKGGTESLDGKTAGDKETGADSLKMPSGLPWQHGADSSDIPLTPENIEVLQKTVGNHAVEQLIQTRLRGDRPDGQSTDQPPLDGERTGYGYTPPRASAEGKQGGASPILRKAAHKPVALKSRAPIMRDGQEFPGATVIQSVNVNPSIVIMFMEYAAMAAAGGFGANADFRGQVGPLLSESIANNLSLRVIPFDFVETRGINVRWRGHVRFKIGTADLIPGGVTAPTNRSFGGTGTVSSQVTESTTDSARLTAGGKAGDAKAGGEGSVGGELGTSSTRSDQRGASVTSNRGGSATISEQYDRYIATIMIEVYMSPELDAGGIDYVNPVKWGMWFGEAVDPMSRITREYTVGVVTFYLPQGVGIQRKGWLEHEMGVTEGSAAGSEKALQAQPPDPERFSRAGAHPLPQPLARAAEEHHGVDLAGINLIQGGQADSYCDSMDAAAFTTPNAEGGSDIFMHSGAPLDSAKGQHTLQHEIAHAVQNRKGETSALEGLGGDASRRDELEKSADQEADAILSKKR